MERIETWASMKSARPRDGSGEPPGPGRNGERDFHAVENRNGLAVDAPPTHATGTAERDAALAMLDRRPERHRITLGADKLFDVEAFVGDLRTRRATPHIAIDGAVSKTGRVRKTAIDGRITRHPGDAIGPRCRKRIEEVFGWTETRAGLAEVKVRSLSKVEAVLTFAAVADNLVRLPRLLAGAVAWGPAVPSAASTPVA